MSVNCTRHSIYIYDFAVETCTICVIEKCLLLLLVDINDPQEAKEFSITLYVGDYIAININGSDND